MTQATYSANSGVKAAQLDIKEDRRGYHRDASNAPEYRDAYDATLAGPRRRIVACISDAEAAAS